jgi:hypothetical protein
MDDNQIGKQLVGKFRKRINAFMENKNKYLTELGEELKELKEIYGDELVNQVLVDLTAGDDKTTATPAEKEPVVPLQKTSPKPRRKPTRRVHNALSLTDFKPKVIEVIGSLTGKQFTIEDVQKSLHDQKIKFEPKDLRVIVPRCVNGIKAVGKQPRRGLSMNIYEVTGPVTLNEHTRLLTADEQKK